MRFELPLAARQLRSDLQLTDALDDLKSLHDRLKRSMDRMLSDAQQAAPSASDIEERKRLLRGIEVAIKKNEQRLHRARTILPAARSVDNSDGADATTAHLAGER